MTSLYKQYVSILFPVMITVVPTLMVSTTDVDDIRLPNILQALQCPPGLPSLPSSLSNKVHSWTVIDFELAEKIYYSVNHLCIDYSPELVGTMRRPKRRALILTQKTGETTTMRMTV